MGLHIPEGYWLIVTIFLVSQPNAGASLLKAAERLAGTFIGATAGILVTIAFPQDPWFKVPVFAFLVALGLFLGRTTTTPYAALLGSMTVILVIGGVDTDPSGDVTRGLWRMLDISTGVLIGAAAQLFLWPDDPEEALLNAFAATLQDTDVQLQRLLAAVAIPPAAAIERLQEAAFSGLASHLDLLRNAEARYAKLRRRHSELLVAITAINRLTTASTSLAGFLAEGRVQPLGPSAALRRDVANLSAACTLLRTAIRERRPVTADPDRFIWMPALGSTTSFGDGPGVLRPILLDIGRALAQLPAALSFLGTTAAQAAAQPELRSPLDSGAPDPIFTPRWTLSNTDDLRFATKGTMATVFCYLLTNAVQWTNGLPAVVSCPIIAQSSVGATFRKAILRLSGSVLGGTLALGAMLYVIPNIATLPPLLLLVAVCAACSGYVTAGSARINYAGVQMGIAFGLGLLDTQSPRVDVLAPLSRVLGIVVGDVVSMLIFYYVWPVFAGLQMRARLSTALRHIAQLSRLGLPDLAGDTLVPPARGFRLQIFQDVAAVLQLHGEAEFELRTTADRRSRDQLLIALQAAQSIALAVMAIVRHRINARFTDAAPHVVQPLRAVALAIGPSLEAAADQLDGRPGAPPPDIDALLADAVAAMQAAATVRDAGDLATFHRLQDQAEFYRALVPMLHELHRGVRAVETAPGGNAAVGAPATQRWERV
jgi:multidrug resistance protein MdtO